jgi:hypothetical protein
MFHSLFQRFRGLIIFAAVSLGIIFAASLLPIKQSITKDQVYAAAAPTLTALSDAGLPTGFTFKDEPNIKVVLADNQILLFASFTGTVFGTNESSIQFVASGRPVYKGTGNGLGAIGRTITTGYELLTGNRTAKRIVFDFTRFDIDDDSFIINGKPAVEFVIPAGQNIVEGASKTAAGKVVTGVLNRFGRDTSDEARDTWTAHTMRRHETLLLTWFENAVRRKVNGQTLYSVGNSPTEQLVASSFGGFYIEPSTVTLKFYVAAILALGISIVFGFFFGIGYWIKRVLFVAKDNKLIELNDETIEKFGDVTESIDSIR